MRLLDAAQQAGTVTAPHAGKDHRRRVAGSAGAAVQRWCFAQSADNRW
jgi:hypothetical protein